MKLNAKERSFVARGLRRELEWHEQQLKRRDLTEDEASDLTNDLEYVRALLAELDARPKE